MELAGGGPHDVVRPGHRPSEEGGDREIIEVVEPVGVFAHGLCHVLARARPHAAVQLSPGAAHGAAPAPPPGPDTPALVADVLILGPSLSAPRYASADARLQQRVAAAPATVAVVDAQRRSDYSVLLSWGVTVLWDVSGDAVSLARAVEAATRGEPHVSATLGSLLVGGLAQQMAEQQVARSWSLTPREREILQLLALGRSNREISEELFISENTVKNHVRSILDKTQAKSRTEAVSRAARSGLVRLV